MKRLVRTSIPVLVLLLCGCVSTDGGRRIPARFECEDGARLDLVFDHVQDAAILRLPKGRSEALASTHPDSGMSYAGDGFALKGAGDTLVFSGPGRAPTRCTQIR